MQYLCKGGRLPKFLSNAKNSKRLTLRLTFGAAKERGGMMKNTTQI
jgi:hypothetical protein